MFKIKEISFAELPIYHQLQIDGFSDLYAKYQDTETSPGAQTLEFIEKGFNLPGRIYLLCYQDEIPVGGAKLIFTEQGTKIGPLFIGKPFQDKHLGREFLLHIEAEYSEVTRWYLGTLKQEAKLMHFYSSLGYKIIGEESITDTLDEVLFEKVLK